MRKKIYLIIVGLIVGTAVLEILLQLFYRGKLKEYWQTTDQHQLDSELILTLIPNHESYLTTKDFTEHTQTNSQGFRDREITTKKPDTVRIVVVGDSFVFGHGISENEYTYPNQLEIVLKKKFPKKDIEVLNTGVKGYSPDQEYRFITMRLFSLEPDFVIWGINPSDVINLLENPSLYDLSHDGRLVPTSAKFTWLFGQGWFIQNAPYLLKKSKVATAIVDFLPQVPWFNRVLFISQKDRLGWAQKKLTAEFITASKFLYKENIQFIVVLFPTKVSYINGEYKHPDEDINMFLVHVKNESKRVGIPFYDVGEDIWKKYDQHRKKEIFQLFIAHGYHFNEKGAQVAAEITAGYFVQNLLL